MKFTAVAALLATAAAYRVGLYGLSDDVQLIYQYPNGTSTNVSAPLPMEGDAQQLSTLDGSKGIYYLLGWNFTTQLPNLISIDINSGAVLHDVTLPFVEGGFVGVGQQIAFDSVSGRVIVGGQLVADGPHTVGWVDPTTGKFTQVASLPASYLPVLGGAAIYDPQVGDFVVPLGTNDSISFFSVNMATGKIAQWNEAYPTGHNLDTLDYDPVTGLIYGLGLRPLNATNAERTLVSLDAKSQTWKVVGSVLDYTVESGGIAALDYKSRLLYWIGQKTGAGVNDPFYLIGLSLSDASVRSAADLCDADAACPWTLEYANPK